MRKNIAAQQHAYIAFIDLHNHVHALPRLAKANILKKNWPRRYEELLKAVHRQAQVAGFPDEELDTILKALSKACRPFYVVGCPGVTQMETQKLTVARQRLLQLCGHQCDCVITTNRTGYAIPPCPSCGSNPGANGNDDGVCPGCGDWTYFCGVFDAPSAEGVETIGLEIPPAWCQLPSQMPTELMRVVVAPSVEPSTDQPHASVEPQVLPTGTPAVVNGGDGADNTKKGKRKKSRRGRPVDTDPKADKRLCADWKEAKAQGVTRKTFARGRGISVNDIIAALDREKYRRQRDAE